MKTKPDIVVIGAGGGGKTFVGQRDRFPHIQIVDMKEINEQVFRGPQEIGLGAGANPLIGYRDKRPNTQIGKEVKEETPLGIDEHVIQRLQEIMKNTGKRCFEIISAITEEKK